MTPLWLTWHRLFVLFGAIGILAGNSPSSHGAEAGEPMMVGAAQVDVTPEYPVRLHGFGGRRTESEGVTHKIWAKALAFGDAELGPALIITTDNLAVPETITRTIAERLAKSGVKRDRLSITASHTHTAPMLKDVAPTLFGAPVPPEHQANIDRYTREFTDNLEQVALAAIRDIRPGRVAWGVGMVDFAANRRTKGGPVDHDLPVMVVRGLDGKPRAIYFSYACHCVTLSNNKISGDWAGYAMEHVQQKFPGAIALASVGCGADSNPSSGVTGAKVEVASGQGAQIAAEVARLLGTPLTPLTNRPATRTTRIQLSFAGPRTRQEWESRAKAQDAAGHHARVNLKRLDAGQTLPTELDYPVQSWIFGDQLAMVFLPGEVVVDYSLRLKREFDRQRLWMNAYANDAACYIPSERVLKEGGYEGGSAMIYYDKPNKFAPGLEQKIIDAVRAQVPKGFRAPEGTEGSAPLSPARALNTLRTKPGLTIELAAAEPLVTSPVAIDWDAAGHLWVCEMFDYPTGIDENWQPGGRVKRLRDTNGDGVYDDAIVFLDGLPFPTGLMNWGRGVLICAAPDIIYAEDTNNDGKADRVEKWFSGFAAENYQARVNSLSLGLDNWIYGANGLLGGVIRGRDGTVDTRGHDFRFRFSGGAMETVNGLTQQGRVRDDWGRWFGCDNGNALSHYPHEARYLRRNPNVPAPPSSIRLPGNFDVSRVYPASRLLERFNDPNAANRITSGCGLGIYRDTLLGEEYYNNTFTCEPVHNLVHRLVLKEDGMKLSRRRAADEAQSEFLASTDNWFRPVQVRTGPDGALYVVDMYRFLIEHPRWIPAARLSKINVRAGAELGRIYRLRPAGQPLRAIQDLTRMDARALGATLNSPNGTERDRVHVELLSRKDSAAASSLQQIAQSAELPQARLQALSALDGLDQLDPATLGTALGDRHEKVRAEAVRLAERFLNGAGESGTSEVVLQRLSSSLLALTNDMSLWVVRQLAFTLGEWKDPRAGRALAHIARAHLDQPEIRTAVLSSAGRHGADVLSTVLSLDPKAPGASAWTEPLVATAAASNDENLFNRALLALLPADAAPATPGRLASLAHLLNALERRNTSPEAYFKAYPELNSAQSRLQNVLASASRIAADTAAATNSRDAAIRLLGRASASDGEIGLLCEILTGVAPDSVRAAAAAGLRRQRSGKVPDQLLARWAQTSPAARQEIVNLLLGRDPWTLRLLDAIKGSIIQPAEISLTDRQRLAQHSDESIRRLAGELLPAQSASARADVLQKFQPALALAGRESHGREVYAKNCMSCHVLKGMGFEVGPDLATLRGKEPDYWLKNILDPNAVIEPRFVSYEIETRDDRSLSGVIKAETASSLTLVAGNGVTETISRSEIKSIRASSLSLMPEGLDQAMTLQDMADLLAFIIPRNPPKRFAGNEPALAVPAKGEILMLPAARAEIFGDRIAFEEPFKNIGMWHGTDAYVAWALQVNKPGRYDVYIDFACANSSAGNPFRITIGSQSVTGRVSGTGSAWDKYVQKNVGTVELEPGQHRLTFRADGALRGALIDLRTVALCPPGSTPTWPAGTAAPAVAQPEMLLRDAPSIARFLLDSAQSTGAREAAIRANPQFAADFIVEMTRGLKPGPVEYERIPWIWRVAIACGKRNEPREIKRVLEVSLPALGEPLRDWQSVVIGGGIINGLSQRGVWPAQAVESILADDPALLKRWKNSLDLAATMTDDTKVPAGTRYDALRMLGMESWEKRGAQLLRYLKDRNAELQMGAVSALVDMPFPQATEALVSALDHLKGHNRELALDGLLRDEARATALLDRATVQRWQPAALGTNRLARLREHTSSKLRARAQEQFQP